VTYDPTPPADAAPKSELEGFWPYLRDLLEAASQRWDQHVVGYDLDQQVSLFQALRARYLTKPAAEPESPRSRLWTGLGVIVVAALGLGARYWLARRRKDEGRAPGPPRSASALLATALYEDLEGLMSSRGIGRAPGTPPLRHAETLASTRHPLAPEILYLTQIYLRARFGGVAVTEGDRSDFQRRVRALRASPPEAQSATPRA
jgi:hypothetical protein